MARNIGPEMLARLDARRDTMTDTEYAARRIEIEELIRKGKAVEVGPLARAAQWALVVVGFAGGLLVATSAGEPLLALALVIGCIVLARWIGRP